MNVQRPRDSNYDYPFVLIFQPSTGESQWNWTSQQFNAYTLQEAEHIIEGAKRQIPPNVRLSIVRLW